MIFQISKFNNRNKASFTLLLMVFALLLASPATGQDLDAKEQPLPQLHLTEDVVVFDTESGNYLFYKRGEEQGKPYKILSKEEFDNESMNKAVQNNWTKRRDEAAAIAGTRSSGFTPRLSTQIESDAFGKVFGGNDITVNFNGTVELLFSIRSTKIDNPLTPPQFRRVTSPNFETKYQLNLSGNIGTRIKMNFTFDPNATFDFETNLKLAYEGTEDDILQFIELGNINMPLRSTLITGSQSLFGAKAGLRFGKLDMTLVASQQRGQAKTIVVQGGSQTNKFDFQADLYDINRHFFLAHYFRDNYERALAQYPLIVSGVNITRLEVWVTNKTNRTDDVRNVVSFMDLGEPNVIFNRVPQFSANPSVRVASNDANNQYQSLITQYAAIRNFASVNSVLEPLTSQNFLAGQDYEKLGRARKLAASEYTYHPQLGYISLNTALNNDEVLAVAYEYTLNGQLYRVGELSTDGTTASDSTLILKQLKGTILSPLLPTWHLMMKNIYVLNAYNLNTSNFLLDVFYDDDELGVGIPYISEGPIAKEPLISVLGVDRLNFQLDPFPDGVFDFVPGVTVIPERGRIIFPVLEPFGSHLKKKFKGDPIASKYVFQELYDSTFIMANKQTERNKFRLQGHYEAANRGEIQLDAMNVPKGSVVVSAGGVKLIEGLDYQVNYLSGTVSIINSGYLESGVPITITLENRELYNMQTKTLVGADLTYNFSKNFRIGGTLLHLNERPMMQKVAYNEDPVSNTIWGLNTSFMTESRMLTNWVNKLPFIETKEKSNFTFDAEVARLIAGQPRGIRGELFIDDFDGAKTSLDLRNYLAWSLASTPQGQADLFPEGNRHNDLSFGYNRAKLAWNWIDPELQRNGSSTPAYIRQNPAKFQERHDVRAVLYSELYPNRELPIGTPDDIQTLNLNFYPRERGPYNYDTDIDNNGFLTRPKERWGGIMRPMTITDFETANYDYIEFWVLDPFIYNQDKNAQGDFYINLGTISEDVLRDGQKSYEQGIPFPFDPEMVIQTNWGYVPRNPPLINTFDNDETLRAAKDVGLDGMKSQTEQAFFIDFVNKIKSLLPAGPARQKLETDPSSDDFIYYRSTVFDERQATILDRYKDFNNQENNSSQSVGNLIYTIDPDMEDINRDNTMEEAESYFQYRIRFSPNMQVGENFINDIRDTVVNPNQPPARWYQFMVPLNQYEKVIGPIRDFRSIRFMRMFMRGFADTTTLRFASLELVRNEWRRFEFSLIQGQEGVTQPEMPNGGFEVTVVNIEENSNRKPVNYVMPPGTDRVIDPSTIQQRQLNEQALQLIVHDLPDGDARAVFKNTQYDFRQYRRMQMDVHAEALTTAMNLKNDDLSVFVRIGNDLRENYYEYEIPLKLTPHGFYTDDQRELVWPKANLLDIDLTEFTDIKLFRNKTVKEIGGSINAMYERELGDHIIRVRGNPDMGNVRSIMIGVRNPINKEAVAELGVPYSGAVWVNEMRLTDFKNRGGWAATARTGVKLADLGNVSLSGSMMTAGFGGLEQRESERSQEDMYRYDLLTNFELGKFFSPKIGFHIPLFFGYSERFATPLFDPLTQDVLYKDAMRSLTTSAEKDSLRNIAVDYTRRKSINITNMRLTPEGSKPGIISISNLSLSWSFNESFQHNVTLERLLRKEYRAALSYGYSITPTYIEPFKKIGFLQSPWLALIRDFNFNLVINQFNFTTDFYRFYEEMQNRNIVYPELRLPATFAKDFLWNRHYNLAWDWTRSLKFTYSASNMARIDEPVGMVDRRRDPQGYRHWRDSVWSNVLNFGRNINFNQNLGLTWQVPFNKLKLTDWITGTGQYQGRFNWDAAPIILENEFGHVYDPGNVISNGRTLNGNLNFSFVNLYNKSKWLKGINDQFDRKKLNVVTEDVKFESRKLSFKAASKRVVSHNLGTTNITVKVTDASGKTLNAQTESSGKNKVAVTMDADAKDVVVTVTGKVPKKDDAGTYAGKMMTRMAMMVRTANISYTQDESSILPGFKGESRFFGLSNFRNRLAPGLDFVLGGQATDFLQRARMNDWLTKDSTMISPHIMRKMTTLNIRFNLEPIKDLQVELTGLRRQTTDRSVYDITLDQNQMQVFGGFEISTIAIRTAFEQSNPRNGYYSNAFETFNKYRQTIAWRLAGERQRAAGSRYEPGGGTFPDGYNGSSQDVLIPAFYAAYTGKSPSKVTLDNFWNIPLPNWRVSYQGFNKADWFKQWFTSGRITHSYTASYAINAYNQNPDFFGEEGGFSWVRNNLGNFITKNNMLNVSIRESFNPLFGLDLGWKNDLSTKFSINKNRSLGLSLANNQVTELKNVIYSIEVGYFFRKVPLIFKFGENRQKKVDTDLKVNGRVSVGDERSFLRNLDETLQQAQISSGNRISRLNLSADYTLYKGVTMRLFYDYDFTKPYVAAITTSNTNFGFSLRFSLMQ